MNYYEILNVSKKASKEEITLAHKRLAMKLHPDRNPGDKTVEEEFKKVNKAYSVLNNPEQKEAYDRELENEEAVKRFKQEQNNSQNGFKTSAKENNYSQGNPSGSNNYEKPKFTPNSNTSTSTFTPKKEQFVKLPLHIGFWDAIIGGKYIFEFHYNNINYASELEIPPGVDNGYIFIVQSGNITFELSIQVSKDTKYSRENLNLYAYVDIPFNIAMLGGEVIFEHYRGDINIQIIPNSKNGTEIFIPGQGITSYQKEVGDLTLYINIILPENLTDRQIELIKEFMLIENKKEKGLYFFKTAPFWEAIRKKFITI